MYGRSGRRCGQGLQRRMQRTRGVEGNQCLRHLCRPQGRHRVPSARPRCNPVARIVISTVRMTSWPTFPSREWVSIVLGTVEYRNESTNQPSPHRTNFLASKKESSLCLDRKVVIALTLGSWNTWCSAICAHRNICSSSRLQWSAAYSTNRRNYVCLMGCARNP